MRSETTLWIKRIEEAIEEAKLIPLWGAPPVFPWKEFTRALSETLSLPELRVRVVKSEWKKTEGFLVGLGENPHISSIELSPISEVAFIAISSEDLDKFTSACLTKTQDSRSFSHPDFQEGFFHFLLLEGLNVADQLKCFSDLSAKLGKPSSLHKELGGFCYDIRLELTDEISASIRLICPSGFHGSFRSHFSKNRPSLLESPLLEETILPLHMEIGSTSLEWEKWKKISPGDLLILDRCSFDPREHKGSVTLTLGKTPLFQGRIKEGGLKLLDYAFYQEESMSPSEEDKKFEEEAAKEEGATEEESHLWASEEEKISKESSIEKMISAEEVPLTLTVEIGRLTMSLDKLMQMKPGNLLEMGLNPDQSVHVTLQGKRVARGELVKIGDILGVRILELPQ
ncbi:MAG: type III secretion system cytoplasmic ring protein SctQ [Chlamydiales bacterium]|nr:type III secretion system cytoplasmic ring protein SctQ [Chlamydiales bacterium]